MCLQLHRSMSSFDHRFAPKAHLLHVQAQLDRKICFLLKQKKLKSCLNNTPQKLGDKKYVLSFFIPFSAVLCL